MSGEVQAHAGAELDAGYKHSPGHKLKENMSGGKMKSFPVCIFQSSEVTINQLHPIMLLWHPPNREWHTQFHKSDTFLLPKVRTWQGRVWGAVYSAIHL